MSSWPFNSTPLPTQIHLMKHFPYELILTPTSPDIMFYLVRVMLLVYTTRVINLCFIKHDALSNTSSQNYFDLLQSFSDLFSEIC